MVRFPRLLSSQPARPKHQPIRPEVNPAKHEVHPAWPVRPKGQPGRPEGQLARLGRWMSKYTELSPHLGLPKEIRLDT